MTELLEKRIAEISEAVANGIVVQADAQFLLQMLVAVGDNVVYLKEENEKLKLELDVAVEALREVAKGHTIIEFSGKFNSHGYAQTTTKILATPETEKARAVLAIIERGDK